MNKFSKIKELVDAAPEVVREDMATWIERTKYNAETLKNDPTGWFQTPFGDMNQQMIKNMQPILVKATVKSIYAKYGRSKYVPHQSTKECNRRLLTM